MILFAFDLETTGLDFVKDRPIEVGAILYSTGQKKCLESLGFLVQTDVAISPEITKLTGITQAAVKKFGYDSLDALENVVGMFREADAVIGHNAVRFDKRMLDAWLARESFETVSASDKLWIDTYTDLPSTTRDGRTSEANKLGYMAANAGFLNMFPHSALADCQTVLKLLESYDLDKVIERAKSPIIGIQARQDRSNNDQAKKLKFRWNPDLKIWYRLIKEMDLDEFANIAPFNISVLGKDTFEQIRDL